MLGPRRRSEEGELHLLGDAIAATAQRLPNGGVDRMEPEHSATLVAYVSSPGIFMV